MSENGGRLAVEVASDSSLRAYIKDLRQTKANTGDDNIRLARLARKGDSLARAQLITGNQGLLVRLVDRYVGIGVPAIDLIMAGAVGLTEAADSYDPRLAASFSHFAWYYIRGRMLRELFEQLAPTGMPEHMFYKWLRLKRSEAGQADVKLSDISDNDLKAIRANPGKPVSLDMTYDATLHTGNPGDSADISSVGDFIPSNEPEIDNGLLARDLRAVLENHIDKLTKPEAKIIRLRYWDGLTQADVAHRLGYKGHQRVQQIEARALRKLREFITLANYVAG